MGGNGGIKVRVTDLLCKVETEAQVLEYCGAFIQLYREEGHYLERTAPWVERVGLNHIKQHVVDDAAGRAELFERFKFSQQFVQTDPWKERAEGKAAHEYQPIRIGVESSEGGPRRPDSLSTYLAQYSTATEERS